MDPTSGDVSGKVFRRVTKADLGEFSLDGNMLNVLMSLDGKKDLPVVASEVGLSLDDARQVMSRLLELGLAESVEAESVAVDQEFLDYLNNQLVNAVGPVASVLMEDVARDLGHELSKFPGNRAAELIVQLSQEIQQEDMKHQFKQNMLNKIKQKGY